MTYDEVLNIASRIKEDNDLANKYRELQHYQRALRINIVTEEKWIDGDNGYKGKHFWTLTIEDVDGKELYFREIQII